MIYPVFAANTFKIGTAGITSQASSMKTISCVESFSVSIDNGIEEFNPLEAEGWVRRLMTAKSISISLNGKRDVGDAGNDYVASKLFATGSDATTKFEWTMVGGTKVEFDCVINVSSAGGDSTSIEGLEFEVLSDGKPTVTPPSSVQ